MDFGSIQSFSMDLLLLEREVQNILHFVKCSLITFCRDIKLKSLPALAMNVANL